MITEIEKRIQNSKKDQSFNAVIKCRKRDLAKIKEALKEIPHDVATGEFSLEEYYNSSINN